MSTMDDELKWLNNREFEQNLKKILETVPNIKIGTYNPYRSQFMLDYIEPPKNQNQMNTQLITYTHKIRINKEPYVYFPKDCN